MKASVDIVAVTEEIVFLADRDDGGISVTNDAEAVVKWTNECYPGKRIVYRDTMGQWDELRHQNGVFTEFNNYEGEVPRGLL